MYSKQILSLLKKKGIAIGDEVRLESSKGSFTGLLMPRPEGAENTFVIKLPNGYNVGIDSAGAELELVKKAAPKPARAQEPEGRGEIAILGCGGTISSKVEYKTGAVFPAISPQELKNAFPDLGKIAKVHARQLFSLFSEDMNSHHWQEVAREVEKEIKAGAKGVVLMHGTDTMSYTSAAISFMLRGLQAPVVFVGAQRSSDRPSSDNEANLLNAVYAARQDMAEVGVCMHAGPSDDCCHLHRGTRVRKLHTSARDAFKSVNCAPMAKVDYRRGMFEALSGYRARGKGEPVTDTRMSQNVALIYVHPNIQPKFISSLGKYDGVVLMGTGLGHVATNPFGDKSVLSVLPAVRELTESGVAVAMAAQPIYGRVNMNVYTSGRLLMEAGVMGDGLDMTPETAFVKLSWILGHEKKIGRIREEYHTNLAGEFGQRSFLGETA